jgi:ubiquinol-cytochrome c reductase cytochrome b subunit/menaquinol-cytochrome c reductase cytochrome b subunit
MGKRRTKAQQAGEIAMIPVDWLEERSGLIGALKYFLFRKVPAETNWFHTLGSATLTAFIVQLITGVILAMYYKPDPETAYQSIQYITNDLTLGWLVRGMHRWGASVFIILLFLHMGRVFLFGAYKYPRELNWLLGVLLLVMAMLEGFTGYLLPWDQTAYWATVVGINLNSRAQDPVDGHAHLDRHVSEAVASVPLSQRYSWSLVQSDWYLLFRHLDRYYDLPLETELTASTWTDAERFIQAGTMNRRLGFTAHPKYLEVAHAVGITDVWNHRGPPDFCRKVKDHWVCE